MALDCRARKPINRTLLTNRPEMCVEPIRDQRGVSFPSRICMSNAFAHNEPGGDVHVIETLDESTRLLNRYGFILVDVNQNCRRISSSHMHQRRMLPQHPTGVLNRRDWS